MGFRDTWNLFNIIKIGLWGMLYYDEYKRSLNIVSAIMNHLGFYIRVVLEF